MSMLPLSISRSALTALARVLGLAAVLVAPAVPALARPEPPAEARVPLCTTGESLAKPVPGASHRATASLCPVLVKWLDQGGDAPVATATTVRIPVQAMRADRAFWLSIPAALRSRLRTFDWIEVARIPVGLRAAPDASPSAAPQAPAAVQSRTGLHPSARPAASQR
jgi:hypothetical protein